MDRTFAPPASRNSACPCGSGRRYKDCHGAIGDAARDVAPAAASVARARSAYRAPGDEWAHLDDTARDACGVLMERALRHQTEGRNDEAADDYRAVLAQAPATHDALHMLGVIRMSMQDLEEAERLITAAMALRAPYPAIEHNLQLVRDARAALVRAQPEQLAERALPIMAELALCGPRPLPAGSAAGKPVADPAIHLIGATLGDDDAAWLLRRLCELLDPRRTSVWTSGAELPKAIAGVRARSLVDGSGAVPRGGTHVYVGLDVDCEPWIHRATAERVLAVVVGAVPSLCLDRLRTIARDGARRVELVLLSRATAERFGRGHHVVVPPFVVSQPIARSPRPPVYGEWTIEEAPDWPVGVSGQTRHDVGEPADVAFLRSIATTIGCLHVHDPGRLRYALGAQRDVRFMARQPDSLSTFLAALGCYVYRVEHWWDEGAGRELFAAMAAGLPVLCPRRSVHAEALADGVDALLYGSEEDALAKIVELRRAPAYAAAMGRAAREKVARLFDPETVATSWRDLVGGEEGSLRWSANLTLPAAPRERAAS